MTGRKEGRAGWEVAKCSHGCCVRGRVRTVCAKPRGPVGLSDGVPCGEGGGSWKMTVFRMSFF